MNKKFWKKLAIIFTLGFGVLTLGACQTTDQSKARIDIDHSSIRVLTESAGTPYQKTYAEITVVYENPTIYDALQFYVEWKVFTSPTTEFNFNNTIDIRVGHGVTGYTYTKVEIGNEWAGSSAIITNQKVTKFDSLWGSYLAWWIVAITIASFAVLFYAIDLFRRNQTVEDLRELAKDKLASSVIILLLVALICLFPLIWGGWVATLILLGGFVAFLLVAGILTGVRIGALSKKGL